MANCLGCGKQEGLDCPGLCSTCRRRLRVGDLVEGMGQDSCLMKSKTGSGYAFDPDMDDAGAKWIYGETALEALEKGTKK